MENHLLLQITIILPNPRYSELDNEIFYDLCTNSSFILNLIQKHENQLVISLHASPAAVTHNLEVHYEASHHVQPISFGNSPCLSHCERRTSLDESNYCV